MNAISCEQELTNLVNEEAAVLVLFGGESCGVCQVIKPQLERLAREEFPRLVTAYVDCQAHAGSLCAARGIFSLPVVQLWFAGQRFAEFVRAFSIGTIRQAIERPYAVMQLTE